MAVKIRLRRMGAKKNPFYRIVVADSRFPRDGRFIEEIGTYNLSTNPAQITVDAEKAATWIKNGAQPTETVKSILKNKRCSSRFNVSINTPLSLSFFSAVSCSLVLNPVSSSISKAVLYTPNG